MSGNWNTRSFKKLLATDLCQILSSICASDQILIIQPEILPLLNKLLTFTQLTDQTPVRKIVILDDTQVVADLENVTSTMPPMELVFLIDVKTNLTIPSILTKIRDKFALTKMNIVYQTWKTQPTNHLEELPHFIKSQLSESVLFPWFILPIPQLDDNVLIADVLYNDDNDNLYHPKRPSVTNSTRSILRDNMMNCVLSLLQATNSTISDTVSIGNESTTFINQLKAKIDSDETVDDVFIKSTLYGNKYDTNLETDLIVLERDVDPITPMLTQLSYVGILDDFFQFDHSVSSLSKKDVKFNYTDDDIWQDIKYCNFGTIGPILNKMAKDLQLKYDSRHTAETVGEIKNFVESLSTLQENQKLLNMHTTLSSDVLDEVENNPKLQFSRILEFEQDILSDSYHSNDLYLKIIDLIHEGEVSQEKILKLICLISICKRGIKDHELDSLKVDLVDRFGVESLLVLQKLQSIKYLANRSKGNTLILKKDYKMISKWLETLPIDENENSNAENEAFSPTSLSFAFCGVVPITVRILQFLYERTTLSKSYSAQQPFILSKEPSLNSTTDLFEKIYGDKMEVQEARWVPTPSKRLPIHNNKKKGAIQNYDISLIVFLGGITLGEIAVIKHLQESLRMKGIHKRFIIIADGIFRFQI